ncbi:hypothetical protein [Niameybacter massiliensis]|uniref:hypothetical protein n=1 Tax=Niameybacter massiliensis TaxID=1658108 RepID=UPI0006B57B93|nr:hypothetical protein [Niameybacter massiliensis]
MSKSRDIVPVGFDNDPELHEYVKSKCNGNKSEFIRYCIRKEMMEERRVLTSEKDLDTRIEKIVKKYLEDFQPILQVKQKDKEEDNDLVEAASFFDED